MHNGTTPYVPARCYQTMRISLRLLSGDGRMVTRTLTSSHSVRSRHRCHCCAATFWPFDRATRLKPATGNGFVVVCVSAQGLDREDDRSGHAVFCVGAGGQDNRFNLKRVFCRQRGRKICCPKIRGNYRSLVDVVANGHPRVFRVDLVELGPGGSQRQHGWNRRGKYEPVKYRIALCRAIAATRWIFLAPFGCQN